MQPQVRALKHGTHGHGETLPVGGAHIDAPAGGGPGFRLYGIGPDVAAVRAERLAAPPNGLDVLPSSVRIGEKPAALFLCEVD